MIIFLNPVEIAARVSSHIPKHVSQEREREWKERVKSIFYFLSIRARKSHFSFLPAVCMPFSCFDDPRLPKHSCFSMKEGGKKRGWDRVA